MTITADKLHQIVHRQILLTRLRDWWASGKSEARADVSAASAIAEAHSDVANLLP